MVKEPSPNLKKKAVAGMIWTALQKYSTMIIQFISGIIFARLLTPHDYGCIGMLMIFMVLAESFIDGGFGSALIQKKRPTQEDYSTIFFWNMGMALLLYVVLYLSAPYIAQFYKIPLLCNVLRVQCLILFIYAFNIVQRNQLQKTLNFKVLSQVTITTAIINLFVTVYLAYNNFGVWALVVNNMLAALIPALFFWFYIKWRPLLVFSTKSFQELFSFGLYMFLTNLLNQLGNQIQGLLIGRFYNSSTLGFYSKAYGTESLASSSISQIMTQVTYPLYAEVQDNKEKLSSMIKQITMTLSYITFPLMFILLLCAKPIFIILYSERWIESVPYFQVLCLAGLAYCLQSVNYQSISAIGKSRSLFLWTVVKRVMGIIFVVLGLFVDGMKGLLIGMVINTWFSYAVNIGLVSKFIGYKWYIQLKDIMPVMVVSVLAAIASYMISSLFLFSIYIDSIVKISTYAIVYIGWSCVFKPEASDNVRNILMSIKKNIKLINKTS